MSIDKLEKLKAQLVGTLYEEEELDKNEHYFNRIVK